MKRGMLLGRAVLGGLALGLGLAVVLIVYKVIAFGTKTPFLVVAVCLIARLLLEVAVGRRNTA
jgi:hypothetical protein